MSHLRVELQSLRRRLVGGYGFDLTRFCAGCWAEFGRITRRGYACSACRRKVCKACRHFVGEREWICILCHRKKYCPGGFWHDDANLKRFKASQGRCGTYLLRLTDWSSRGVLDVHAVKDSSARRPHSFYNERCDNDDRVTARNIKSKSELFFDICGRGSDWEAQLQPANGDQFASLAMMSSIKENCNESKLKYTSTTLKQRRRAFRESKNIFKKRISSSSIENENNDFSKSKKSTVPSFVRNITLNESDFLDEEGLKGSSNTSTHQIQFPDLKNRLTATTRSMKTNSKSSANGGIKRELLSNKTNCNNFPLESPSLNRNDPHMRFSVRGNRIFNRKKTYRACLSPKEDDQESGKKLSSPKGRSLSLPCELPLTECHDFEFWNAGFVQCRVRRLEEDLSANWDDGYSLWNPNFEVQSLCSLELDRIRPDSEDYRIAYLSSTSQESSLDYIDDNFSSLGMGTLDVKINKKCCLLGNEDWDLSFSSNGENDSSSEDDEFYFLGKELTNESSNSTATLQCNSATDNFSNESKKYSSLQTTKNCSIFPDFCDEYAAEACCSDGTKCNETATFSGFLDLNGKGETATQFDRALNSLCEANESLNETSAREVSRHFSNTKSSVESNGINLNEVWHAEQDVTLIKDEIVRTSLVSKHALSKNREFISSRNCISHCENIQVQKNKRWKIARNADFASITKHRQKFQIESYEPLCTPFAEIYSINCRVSPMFQMATSQGEKKNKNKSVLNEMYSSTTYLNSDPYISNNIEKGAFDTMDVDLYSTHTSNSTKCDLELTSKIPTSATVLSYYQSVLSKSEENGEYSHGNKISCEQSFTYFLSDSYEVRRVDLIFCLKPKINIEFLTQINIELSHFYCVLPNNLKLIDNIVKTLASSCNSMSGKNFSKTLNSILEQFLINFYFSQYHNEGLQVENFHLVEKKRERTELHFNPVNGLLTFFIGSKKFIFEKNNQKSLAPKMILDVEKQENKSNQTAESSCIISKVTSSELLKLCGLNISRASNKKRYLEPSSSVIMKECFKKRSINKKSKELKSAYIYIYQKHAPNPNRNIVLHYFPSRNKCMQMKNKNYRKEEKQIEFQKNISPKHFTKFPIQKEFGKRKKNKLSNASKCLIVGKIRSSKLTKTLNLILLRFFQDKQLRKIYKLIQNRNHWEKNNNHSSETEISARGKGETSESGFFSDSQAPTSQTGSTAFVEYLVLPQCTSARKRSRCVRGFRSPLQLSQQSVPAVQRVSREREACTATLGTLCLVVADGAVILRPTADGDRNSCRIDRGKWLNSLRRAVKLLRFGYPLILDYSESQRTALLDYRSEGYFHPGYVLTETFEQLICDFGTVSRCRSDSYILCSDSVYCRGINDNMATSDGDTRHVHKVTRTPGRNISKLKKFFDSNNVPSFIGNNNSSLTNSEIVTSNPFSENNVHVVENNTPDGSNSNISSPVTNSTDNPPDILINATTNNNLKKYSDSSAESLKNSTSGILYSTKSLSGDLWKNVDIGAKNENEVWTSAQSYDTHNFFDNFSTESKQIELKEMSNAFVASTAELNCLIATSRAELSKKQAPVLSDKSTLENYFTSFENTKCRTFVPLENIEKSHANCNSLDFKNSFDCDIDEITFDDEDAIFSDTSSDEEIKNHPSAINTYLPSYALHTIIEESCEESERDSRGATPTNNPATSKLERYFSWDIINDNEHNLQKKDDDESTIYSDSLSEGSGSVNGDAMKEIDPIQLASSRLEKYFTSGLVGNENYFYPDDAEFLDDPPVSDFEEDSIHQKISRSALLNSLETKPNSDSQLQCRKEMVCGQDELCKDQSISEKDIACDNIHIDNESNVNILPDKKQSVSDIEIPSDNVISQIATTSTCDDELSPENITHELKPTVLPLDASSSLELKSDCNDIQKEVHNMNTDSSKQKQVVSKEQLAIDAQAIIKKLLMYFSHSTSEAFQEKTETDYVSAWQILETEIERLMQSISPTASLENNSCNTSTIDSNNSDYGSDTIESLDCMTDDDDNTDAKSRVNAKYPLSNFLNSTYKISSEYDLRSFHISDETLNIWKRLIHSLQRDNSFIADDKINDVNSEARLYIKEQIITLMHTMTVNENCCVKEQDGEVDARKILPSSVQEKDFNDLNEAFNICIGNNSLLPRLSESDMLGEKVAETESLDELCFSSNENLPLSSDSSHSTKIPVSDFSQDEILPSGIPESVDISNLSVINHSDVLSTNSTRGTKFSGEKLAVDEVDFKHVNRNSESKLCGKDDLNFSVFVDIELGDETACVTQRKPSKKSSKKVPHEEIKTSSCHLWVDEEITELDVKQSDIQELPQSSKKITEKDHQSTSTLSTNKGTDTTKHSHSQNKSQRDTGYFSFKSSDDSLLNSSIPPGDFEVPNFKSLKRSVKKFPLTNTLSKSTNNINQTFSTVESKFSTLQFKSHKSKVSMNPNSMPSRQFTSLFSPSAVFKKLTGSKSNDAASTDSSIPSKYLKKYARSSSVDNESMLGAISMPQLNCPKSGDSYSAIGLYSENDKDSTITIDEDTYSKPYICSQSALSLGSHSASMTSVYSAAGCHYGFVTVSGDVLFGLNYNQKSQMMEVFVKQCRNLAAVDSRRNKSDPYVKVYLLPDKTKGGKRKTKTKKSTLNPVFNELLRFPVLKHELESRTLWLSVWNSDLFGRNDFLGEITLPLGYRLLDSPTLRWYPLQERMESLTSPLNYKGELFLALKYVPRDLSLESRFRPAPVISLRGALHVLVKEARNISANRSNGTFDAFCKSYLLPDKSKSSKQKTPVVKRSRHPKWYYTMIYEDMSIEELKERSLELTIWDHDKITSNEFMGGVRLNTASGLYHGVSVDWMDARRDESALWDAMLGSPNMWVDGCLPLRPTMQFRHS